MLSVLLYIASGLMQYCAMLLAFASGALDVPKWWIFGLFVGLGALLLLGGLALKRFRTWKRDAGIVLLSASGVTTMVALGVGSIFLDDQLRQVLSKQLESLAMFSDYTSGVSAIACTAALGWFLLRSLPRTTNHSSIEASRADKQAAPEPRRF